MLRRWQAAKPPWQRRAGWRLLAGNNWLPRRARFMA